MSRTLDIEAISEVPRFDPRGPVGILITLRNRSHMNIEFDFPYPAPSELSLTSQQVQLRTDESEMDVNREAIPRRLAPGQALCTRHELRRYFHLPDQGHFDIEVRLDITVQPIDAAGEPKGSVEVISWQHTVGIVIEPSVGNGIESLMQPFAQALRGDDEQRCAEAVEAFAHLRSNEALPYLDQALGLRGHRAEAMRGLARIGNHDSLALIEEALVDSDLPTLQVGLSCLRDMGSPIQVGTLQTLVSSNDFAVQYACLDHLLAVGTSDHVAVIENLCHSPNGAVANLARLFLDRVAPP